MKETSREKHLQFYSWLISALGVAAASLGLSRLMFQPFDWRWLALAALAAASSRLAVARYPEARKVITVPRTFLFLAWLLCGADVALLVGMVAIAAESSHRTRNWLSLTANCATVGFTFYAAAWFIQSIFGDVRALAYQQTTFFSFVCALALLTLLQGWANSFLVQSGIALQTGQTVWRAWGAAYPWMLVTHSSAMLTAALVGALMHYFGLAAIAFVAPILAAKYLAFRPHLETAHQQAAALQASESRFRGTFDHSAIGMALIEPGGRFLQVNATLCKMLGLAAQEISAKNFRTLIATSDAVTYVKQLHLLLEGKLPAFQLEMQCLHKMGYAVHVHCAVSLAREVGVKSPRLILQLQDITDRQRTKNLMVHDSMHDSLTGLPNRALFMHHLKTALENVARKEELPFAILFLDVDRFKIINDSLGHMMGDQLLVSIARRLETCLRPGDRVARLGGDEFTIFLKNIGDVTHAIDVAEHIRLEMAQPFNLNGQEVFITASVGIAHSGIGYHKPEEMLRDADTAAYRAKARGKARHEVFDKTMHSNAMSLLQMESDLRRAVERQEFVVHYQPIVTLENGKLRGFEALVRWEHPEKGMISPAIFIPIAEETGLIVKIGQWVLEESLRQLRRWQEAHPTSQGMQMSVNLSGKQFLQPNLIGIIKESLRKAGVAPANLKLELTESVVMDNVDVAINTLKQIRALGIELSVDDFGTGYSSLSYLHKFPLTTLKIDRSFVMNMNSDENKEIVRTIVMLANTLGMDVIAEGIETADQAAQLRALKSKYGQGYYFAKPLSEVAASKLVAEGIEWSVPTHERILQVQPEPILRPAHPEPIIKIAVA